MTEQVKVTYTQNWPAYNAAQCAERDLFFPMLADLCGTLCRPYAGKGRPRVPLSDIAYNSVAKIHSGLSARRFDGDVREPRTRA